MAVHVERSKLENKTGFLAPPALLNPGHVHTFVNKSVIYFQQVNVVAIFHLILNPKKYFQL